jgi:hypothetical protein
MMVPEFRGMKSDSRRLEAERPLSVRSRDLRGDVRQRARRAESGRL